jgi:hypothetical protein
MTPVIVCTQLTGLVGAGALAFYSMRAEIRQTYKRPLLAVTTVTKTD